MFSKTGVSRLTALVLGSAATAPAHAHIAFADPSAKAGSYYVGFLRVSHGCAGSATVSVRVTLPAGITVARPQPKPGWTLSIEKASVAMPIRVDGAETTERVSAITWTGRLDADKFDDFGIMLKLAGAPGTLYFPTIQRCEIGRNEWTTIPALGQPWHSVKNPAPVLNVSPRDAAAMQPMNM